MMRLIDAERTVVDIQYQYKILQKMGLRELSDILVKGFLQEIENQPTVDAKPVQHGQWIWDKDGMDWNIGAWRCSECKAMSPMWWNTDKTSPMNKSGHRYCPNCGARMDGK